MENGSTGHRQQFLFEFLILVCTTLAVWVLFAQWLYPLMDIPATSPMPGRTVIVLGLILALIKKSGESWRDFGLRRPNRIGFTILLVFVLFTVKLFIVQPMADFIVQNFGVSKSDTSVFNHIHGNTLALAAWIVAAWAVGGFAEEFIFRGFLMKRFAGLLHYSLSGLGIAVIAQAILFGTMHLYLGFAGVISATLSALVYGLFFLVANKNLWPAMLVHATWDSLGFILIYYNGIPST